MSLLISEPYTPHPMFVVQMALFGKPAASVQKFKQAILEFLKLSTLQMGGEYRRVSPPLRDRKKNFQGSNMVKTTYLLDRESIIFVCGIRAMFWFYWVGQGGGRCANARRSEEAGENHSRILYPGTVSGREVFRGLFRVRRGISRPLRWCFLTV